jgi:peptidoglycan hydrolase-like protein with peptidoglycan-binding domain
METLAYLHLALANEAPTDPDYTAATACENPKLLNWLNQQKLPTSATIHLLSLTIALGILGIARQASAAVQQGDRGPEVTALQQRLQELGYFQGSATGYFGSVTREAVRQFQQNKGLQPDGVVGTNTSTALNEQSQQSSQKTSESSYSGLLQLGDRGEQVSTIQNKLVAAGFSGGTTGNFDETTEEAVRRFQQTKGLKVDGIVGKQTHAALSAIDTSEPTSATPKTPETPETPTTSATPAPKKPSSFFDSKEGSLSPFIRKPD